MRKKIEFKIYKTFWDSFYSMVFGAKINFKASKTVFGNNWKLSLKYNEEQKLIEILKSNFKDFKKIEKVVIVSDKGIISSREGYMKVYLEIV